MKMRTAQPRSILAGLAICGAAALLLRLIMPRPGVTKDGTNSTEAARPAPPVLTGLEVLMKDNFAALQGKRIGLITNPTGVTAELHTDIDVLAHAPRVKLVALYGPEHGVRGDAAAGAAVGSSRDAETGLPVYSLYGRTRKPTREMLRGVDALVFDIQDIGSRSYTYISTLGYCMEAAADADIPIFVLDRPNPLGGNRIEGNLPAPAYFSFVGRYPIPYAHGLTIGELARMMNGEGWLNGRKCRLTVIPMQGWKRDMDWNATGLPWVPSSPHIPHSRTALYYAATGIVGDQPALNIGVGYTLPFELAGAPGIGPQTFARELNRRKLPGVTFRPISWVSVLCGPQRRNVRRCPDIFHRSGESFSDAHQSGIDGRSPSCQTVAELFS